MKNILPILFLSLASLISACTSQNTGKYTKGLEDSFSNEELDLLNKFAYDFEKNLTKYYESDSTDNIYKQFTSSFSTLSIPMGFMISSESRKAYAEIKKTSIFNKIWTLNSENLEQNIDVNQSEFEEEVEIPIPVNDDDNEKENRFDDVDFYKVNPSGAYMEAVSENTQIKGFKELLADLRKFSDIAPNVVAGAMLDITLTDEDFRRPEVQLFIIIYFYYTQGFFFDQVYS